MKRNKKWRNMMISGLALLVLLGVLEYKGVIWHNSIFANAYEVKGLDVSHYQGEINWQQIKATGKYEFMFVKATEGKDYTDKWFEANWQGAREQRFLTGAYHFFTTMSTGEEQAAHFIKTVPYEQDSLPPVIDLEISLDHDQAKIHKELQALADGMEAGYGKKPILYVTYDTYHTYIENVSAFAAYEIWIRDIVKHPKLEERGWQFWQYHNRGHVAGIDMYVDINVFKGSRGAFMKQFAVSNLTNTEQKG